MSQFTIVIVYRHETLTESVSEDSRSFEGKDFHIDRETDRWEFGPGSFAIRGKIGEFTERIAGGHMGVFRVDGPEELMELLQMAKEFGRTLGWR